MKTNLIYFVHGTTYDNASKKCSGWKQVELNDLGKKQANKNDWRKTGNWQLGWKYDID